MYIQRILRNAFLAELLLFLMVANCAPSRPREDVGQVPGDPASHHQHVTAASRGAKRTPGAGSSAILSGHQRKYRLSTTCSQRGKLTGHTPGDLLRFLAGSNVDARGDPTDPDTEVVLISEPSKLGQIVRVYSPSRKRFMCFHKKHQTLVTRKNPSPNDTLCQFYDTFAHGQRRLISVHGSKQSHARSEPLQLPAFDPLSASYATHRPPQKIDLNAWQVGFDRSGKPLKGSGWRTSKLSSCYDIVYHEEPARRANHHTPVPSSDMFNIFHEINKSKGATANELNSKPNKMSTNKNDERKATGSKHGAQKVGPASKRGKGNKGGKHGSVTRATPEQLSTTQASLPLIEEVERRTNDVSFDSLLAETEMLLSQAKALPAAAAASLVPDDGAVEYSPPRHRSSFILLDSGGWQEVVVDQRSESQQPARQQDDDISISSSSA